MSAQIALYNLAAPAHVVCFSGGHSSALVAIEVVRRYGNRDVVLLNHDIHARTEDADVKRFKRDVAAHLGLPITYANHARWDEWDQFDVVRDAGAFKGANGHVLCTHYLKTAPFRAWLDANETDRIRRRASILGADGWRSDYPLALWPRTILSTRELGIEPPLTYSTFKHANCTGCLKAGWQHWYAVFVLRPDIWERAKEAEREIGYTIHADASLEEREPQFTAMKLAGVEPTERIPHQTFWANARRAVRSLPVLAEERDVRPCECVYRVVGKGRRPSALHLSRPAGGGTHPPLRAGVGQRPATGGSMTTPDTASFEVWRATDDGAECVATAPDKTAAHELMRKRGDAIVLRGDVLAVKYGLHAGERRTIAHVAKFAPRNANGALIPAETPPPPAEEPAAHEEPVKTTETEEATEIPACTAKGCDAHRAAVRGDTRKEFVEFCKRHRKLATDRARDWGVTLKEAAQIVRDGVTERPTERRDAKPANVSQPRKKAPKKPARKPKAPPSPVATLASAITSRLGGLSENDVRRIAHEVVQEELRKLAEAIG